MMGGADLVSLLLELDHNFLMLVLTYLEMRDLVILNATQEVSIDELLHDVDWRVGLGRHEIGVELPISVI